MKPPSTTHSLIATATALLLIWSVPTPALAQANTAAPAEATLNLDTRHEIDFAVTAGYVRQFDDDLVGGTDIDVDRSRVGINARTSLSEQLSVAASFRYALDDYGFDGPTQFAGVAPWNDIHTFTASAIFTWNGDDETSFFGGPVVQVARESGGDTGDALTAGGIVGARWVISNDLVFGIGAGITSEIEDSARFYPIIVLNWKLSDQLTLRSGSASHGASDGGPTIELVYEITPDLDIAFGGSYEFSRFRLDENGPFPNGVGEEERFPLHVRLDYRATDTVAVGVIVGVLADGELTVENASGSPIAQASYDGAATFAGAYVSIRF